MEFGLFDVILLVLLGGFVLFGAWFGFIHTLGSLIGTVVGTFFAGVFLFPVAALMHGIFGATHWVEIITFAVIFLIFSRLIGFAFYIVDKVFQILTRLPFLNQLDRILGAVVGFFEGLLVIGMVLFIAVRFDIGPIGENILINSPLVPWFINVSSLLQPLLPRALKEVRSIIGI